VKIGAVYPGERLQYQKRVNPRQGIVRHDADPFRQAFESANRERFPNVEQSKQAETDRKPKPPRRSEPQRAQTTDDFVENDRSMIDFPELALGQAAHDRTTGEQQHHQNDIRGRGQFPQRQIKRHAEQGTEGSRRERYAPDSKAGRDPSRDAICPGCPLFVQSQPAGPMTRGFSVLCR